MCKFFKNLRIIIIVLLSHAHSIFAAGATAITSGNHNLSTYVNSNPYILQFSSAQNHAELDIDISGNIKSIDLNSSTMTNIILNQGTNTSLGSVYDCQAVSSGNGAQTTITLEDNSILTLTGDNAWATSGGSTAFKPNSFYYDNLSSDFFIIDDTGNFDLNQSVVNGLEAYLFVQLYAAYIPIPSAQTYKGPYNLYSGINEINIDANTNFIVDTSQSLSGNNAIFTRSGPSNYSPTILTNAFSFADSTATLTLNTTLIANHSSIGNFGHIAANNNNSGAAPPALIINAGNSLTTISSIWDNHIAPLFALSSVSITDPSIAGSTIYAGTDTSLYDSSPALAIKPSGSWQTNDSTSNFASNGLYVSNMYPLGNSRLILDSSGATTGQNVHFFSHDTGIGGYTAAYLYPVSLDLAGNVTLQTGNGNALTLDSGNTQYPNQYGSLGSYGMDNSSNTIIARIIALDIYGPEQIDVIMPIYSQTIIFDSSAQVHLVQPDWVAQNSIPPSTMGDAATITLLQDLVSGSSITISGGDPTLQSTSVEINLSTHTFNAGEANVSTSDNTTQTFASNLQFFGDVSINTSFVANQQLTGGDGGHFFIGNGSALDLSGTGYTGVTTLGIQLTADGAVPANGEFSYPLFAKTGNGQVSVPQLSEVEFNYNITNPHPLVPMTWEYDPNTYVISSRTDRSQASNIVVSSGGSNGAIAIIKNLVTPQGNNDYINAQQALALNSLNTGSLEGALNNLEQLVLSSEAEDAVASIVAMHESATQASLLVNTDSLMFTGEEGGSSEVGVAAGSIDNNIKNQQGIWVSGFAQHAKQKSRHSIPGYKVTSYGGTLGFDSGITDNLILGLAWSRADAKLKRTDIKGNRSSVTMNLFSIYGLMNMPRDWLVQSSISGGLSNIASRSIRGDGPNLTVSEGKHKAKYFGADIHMLRRMTLSPNGVIAEPDIGLNISYFNDEAYKEIKGSVNWETGKRQSYNFEAIIGGRLLSSYLTKGDWLLKPYISSYGHITLKDKRGKIYTSLDSKMNGVHLPQSRASKAWYSGGAGIFFYKKNFEISTAWELQLDKGYVSNQGSFKIRVEF